MNFVPLNFCQNSVLLSSDLLLFLSVEHIQTSKESQNAKYFQN